MYFRCEARRLVVAATCAKSDRKCRVTLASEEIQPLGSPEFAKRVYLRHPVLDHIQYTDLGGQEEQT
jgi:hypothetical protein